MKEERDYKHNGRAYRWMNDSPIGTHLSTCRYGRRLHVTCWCCGAEWVEMIPDDYVRDDPRQSAIDSGVEFDTLCPSCEG